MIPYGKHYINQDDVDSVLEVLKSDFITQGETVPRFEELIQHYCKVNFAVAVNSATSALHIACLALGLNDGDIVWTSPISFVASANCALFCNAKVDFVDIDNDSFNLSIENLEEKLKWAKKHNKLPKLLIAVHLSGVSCDMKSIRDLSNIYGFKVIEDASHCIGGRFEGVPIGNCLYSDITVFSFHPVKIITTAEGGVATTKDDALYQKMLLLRSHGIERDSSKFIDSNQKAFYYEQHCLGFNYRMSDIHAAIGVSQIKRLDAIVKARNNIADNYSQSFESLPIVSQAVDKRCYPSFHLYIIKLDENIKEKHSEIFEELRRLKIGVSLHYIPIHTQPFFRKMGFNLGDFPNAENYYARAISLPIFPELSSREQDFIITSLKKVLT